MELIKTDKFIKLIASDGKLLVPKTIEFDEDGNEIPKQGSKVIYIPVNANENDYEEIDELEAT